MTHGGQDFVRLPEGFFHINKGHQRPAGAADLEMTEMCPVDLSLFAWESVQAQIDRLR